MALLLVIDVNLSLSKRCNNVVSVKADQQAYMKKNLLIFNILVSNRVNVSEMREKERER